MKLLILEGIKKTRPCFLSPSLLYFEQKFDFDPTHKELLMLLNWKLLMCTWSWIIVLLSTKTQNWYRLIYKKDYDYLHGVCSWGSRGRGEWTVTAGGRISLSYLELMYKMKWGSLLHLDNWEKAGKIHTFREKLQVQLAETRRQLVGLRSRKLKLWYKSVWFHPK